MKKTLIALALALVLAVSVFAISACGKEQPSDTDKDAVTVLASVSDVYKDVTGKDFPMAGLFVRADVLEAAPGLVADVDASVKASAEAFNNSTSAVAAKAEKINGFSLKAKVIESAAPKMNVGYKSAADSKSDVVTLLGNIGAAAPDDLFATVTESATTYAPSDASYTLRAPDGAPVLALADMWGNSFTEEGTTDTVKMSYSVIAESNVLQNMTSGEADFIVAPINVGANVHNGFKGGNMTYDYKLVNVTSWGVVYFTTNNDKYSPRDEFAEGREGALEFLKQFDGDTVSTIGLAAIPGKTAEYLFKQAEANVTLSGSDATVIQQSYVKGDSMTAVFAEPAITATNIATKK